MFTKQRTLRIHMARWCDGGRTQRSRLGTMTDKPVKTAKRRTAEATLGKVQIEKRCLKMYARSRIWEADSNVMGMTKPTCVIAWTLHKQHSRHYERIIAFHAT